MSSQQEGLILQLNSLSELSVLPVRQISASVTVTKPDVAKEASFDSVLRSIDRTGASAPTTGPKGQDDGDVSKSEIDKANTAKAFETMLVSQFLKPMFSSYTKSMFGDGVQSDLYTSLYTEAVAKEITERGGLGFGKFV